MKRIGRHFFCPVRGGSQIRHFVARQDERCAHLLLVLEHHRGVTEIQLVVVVQLLCGNPLAVNECPVRTVLIHNPVAVFTLLDHGVPARHAWVRNDKLVGRFTANSDIGVTEFEFAQDIIAIHNI